MAFTRLVNNNNKSRFFFIIEKFCIFASLLRTLPKPKGEGYETETCIVGKTYLYKDKRVNVSP